MKGYFGIGCLNMKTSMNYGSLFRTAQIFEADFIFLIGPRFKRQASDTMKSWRNMPLFQYNSFQHFNESRPYDCPLVGIELDHRSRPLQNFVHPKKAIYLLGAEDNGLTEEALNACQAIIQLPGKHSLNVAVAGSIVLFDRINKMNLVPSNMCV